jgi:hypothetical protein
VGCGSLTRQLTFRGTRRDDIITLTPATAGTLVQPPVEVFPTLAEVLSSGNSAGSRKITNLTDPTAAQDAVTKAYADALAPAGGGDVSIERTAVPYNLSGLVAGVDVYTPAVNEFLLNAIFVIKTAFDGTTPQLNLYPSGVEPVHGGS